MKAGTPVGASLLANVFLRVPKEISRASSLLQVVMLGILPGMTIADYQTGLNAYVDGDFERALAEWKAEVNQPGEPANLAIYRETLYAIGMLYWQGEGVAQDYTVAAVWMKQAADINHPGAQNKLGYLYSTGQGVPQNFAQARRYFEMAAAQGDPDASHNLDQMFRQGLFAEAISEEQAAAKENIAPEEPLARPVDPAPLAAEEPPSRAEPGEVIAARAQRSNGFEGADWIRAQNPEHYTLQVIALRAPDRLMEFVAEHPDWAPYAIYLPPGNERPLSVLVQGVYPDVEAARAAAQSFPPGLQKPDQIWIRKFGMVQELLE
jgi:hypothetical protein